MDCFFLRMMAKEYADVNWGIFASLFVVSVLPFVLPTLRELNGGWHQVWNLFINFFVRIALLGTTCGPTGDDAIGTAMLIGFGVGYSILTLRKNARGWFGWFCLAVFLLPIVAIGVSLSHS